MAVKNATLRWLFTLLFFQTQLLIIGQSFTKLTDPVVNSKTGSWRSTALIDYNNNYTLDIFIGAGDQNANGFLVNIGDSSFIDSSMLAVALQSSAAGQGFWADVDNDCDMDVYWADIHSTDNAFFINNGAAGFSKVLSGPVVKDRIDAVCANWLDFNQDGNIDLFVPSWDGDTNYLYQNNGNLNFTRIDTGALALTTGDIWASTPADIDNDGDVDIFFANKDSNGHNYLLVNQGNGYFINDNSSVLAKDGNSCQTASWGDYNNDGYLDLFVGRHQLSNLLYRNNGDGTFTKVSGGGLTSSTAKMGGSVWADFDNDGFLDIYVSTPGNSSNANLLFRNNGNETFSSVSTGTLTSETLNTEGCNAADLNNDGFLDIINSNRFSQPITIYLNDGNSNNYLKLGLFGSSANHAAIGSRVVITTSSGKQTRYLAASNGRRSQEPFEIHFGLGQDTIVDTLKIFWPGGGSCTLTDVVPNAFYNVGQLTCSLDSTPQADFSDSTRFLTAYFKNLSDGAISGYLWDFGDGSSSTQVNPTHRYNQSGTYLVTLKVFDNFCKVTTITDSVSICPDTARLGFTTSGIGQTISFVDSSISNGYNFQWDFGDGTTLSGDSVSHRYNQGGTYSTCLYVTDSCRIDTICQTIQVCNDTLLAAFGDTVSGYSLALSDSSINAYSIYWDFGDGSNDTIANPIHTYSTPGNYFVCMIINDNCGADTICKTIGICLDTAVADFNFSASSNTVNFTSTSQHATSYTWDFGDGNTSNSNNPTYTYPQYGTYSVCLIVENDCYTDTICKTVSVCLDTAIAAFSYSDTITIVSFTSQAQNANTYFWDFGDGSFSTLKSPTYTYQQYGTYTVCMAAINDCGSDTTCKQINICPKVAKSDYNSQHVNGLQVQFYQLCSNAVSYSWDFDDGNYSNSPNPLYAFNSAWVFNVCLTVTDSCGKMDTYCEKIDLHQYSLEEASILQQINIYPNPTANKLFLEFPNTNKDLISLSICDLQGKTHWTKDLQNIESYAIDLADYPSGVYLLKIEINGVIRQFKIGKS